MSIVTARTLRIVGCTHCGKVCRMDDVMGTDGHCPRCGATLHRRRPHSLMMSWALLVAAAVAKGTTRITGAAELRVKESDRIAAMARGLEAVGVQVEEAEDGITVHGGGVRGGVVDSLGDHRIAMSFAALGAVAADGIEIRDVANVQTSFPGFIDAMSGLGLNIEQLP